ncbi:TetR/AcrR family transcriptional regulator [Paracrocinitomix mangrovi]|uniref:TetR/AcrR family transcriptional regulator n=1 Tax=Paracrocinitomix mangrovi TaxID=2862509 RepID=UPI001C8D8D2B|nr:TetR/AcrR family transcriptional regulator [Paracrocinitomix mangrovi]UKN01250.1 TetR/AcrR family transcriptional regulator [Paracrocinitomix mangrovi]
MATKAEQTTEFIVKKVAPIFNKHGYYGTSLSDLTKATGLTKGAIYGNFKNKEELAFVAFKFNVDRVVNKIKEDLFDIKSPIQQLYGLTNFYRKYKAYTIEIGGCPIVNIGVDANHENEELLKKVQEVISKLQYYITKMIANGIEAGEIKKTINPEKYGRYFFTMIEGAVFMTATMNDETYLQETMNRVDDIIEKEMAVN